MGFKLTGRHQVQAERIVGRPSAIVAGCVQIELPNSATIARPATTGIGSNALAVIALFRAIKCPLKESCFFCKGHEVKGKGEGDPILHLRESNH
jgi:hypothetical protein